MYENLIGKKIKILAIGKDDVAAERYVGRTGTVKEVKIDCYGETQLWGSWGGIAIYPNIDSYEIVKKGEK